MAFEFPSEHLISLFSKTPTPALGPTQPATQWVLAVKRPKPEADYVQLMIKLRMIGAIPLSLYTPSSRDMDLSMSLPCIVSDFILAPVSN
jgi:hypothetical protein